MKILYTDGGCSGNGQLDMSKRKMIAVVASERGKILVDKTQEGGSNNIAELLAVKEAMLWCVNNKVKEVIIITDSVVNMHWVQGGGVGLNINDRDQVIYLLTAIHAATQDLKRFGIVQMPREKNLAGHYIEKKYTL